MILYKTFLWPGSWEGASPESLPEPGSGSRFRAEVAIPPPRGVDAAAHRLYDGVALRWFFAALRQFYATHRWLFAVRPPAEAVRGWPKAVRAPTQNLKQNNYLKGTYTYYYLISILWLFETFFNSFLLYYELFSCFYKITNHSTSSFWNSLHYFYFYF